MGFWRRRRDLLSPAGSVRVGSDSPPGCHSLPTRSNPSTYKKQKHPTKSGVFCFGGKRGIRTLGTVLAFTRFPVVRLRPAQPSFHIKFKRFSLVLCNYIIPNSTCQQLFFSNLILIKRKIVGISKTLLIFLVLYFIMYPAKHKVLKEKRRKL